MITQLILNEASLPFATKEECENNLSEFFAVLHFANQNRIDLGGVDNIEREWASLNYSEGFSLGHWINNIADQDAKLTVKSVLSSVRCPDLLRLHVILTEALRENIFHLTENPSIEVRGLGAASLLDGSGVSFSSHDYWRPETIQITKYGDGEQGPISENIIVRNISTIDHVRVLAEQLQEIRQQNKTYLKNLKTQDNPDFQNLIFCSSALSDLRSTTVTANEFDKVLHALNRLNEAIINSNNNNELIVNSQLTISGESVATMNNPKFAVQRRFKHPTDGYVIFETHVKDFPNAKRMHILPDYAAKKICIGYFGKHLQTVNFND